ncbi:MAG TPA: hypothetical protein VME17_21585 [Bryobacteraceae bacterium]|nr:hypothetical protein [Bryobacteraceae bacterium]
MQRFRFLGCVIAMLLLMTGAGVAQSMRFNRRSYPAPDPYRSSMNTYYRTWSDLNQAERRVSPYPGDGFRFDVALGQMDLLERTWKDGSYDRAQLNQAISDLQFILKFNNIAPQDRAALAQDLEQLHNIRVQYAD